MLALQGVEPALLHDMESEHHAMAEALSETGAAMTALATSGAGAAASAERESVVRTQAVVEQHFAHEESELEPQLQPLLETPQRKAAEKTLRRQPPERGRTVLRLAHRRHD